MRVIRKIAVVCVATAAFVGIGMGLSGTAYAAPSSTVASAAAPTWQTAVAMPGNDTEAGSVSCASAGNCSAGGRYIDSSGDDEAYVMNEVDGAWQSPETVPGLAALNLGTKYGASDTVSCVLNDPGICSAGGQYTDSSEHGQAFVANEVNGTWQPAEEVPGLATLNTGGDAEIDSVSCEDPVNCSAAGDYTDNSGKTQAFVVNEVEGTWQSAEELPGFATLNKGDNAYVTPVVSCAAAGWCAVSGYYEDSSSHFQVYVADEQADVWQSAEEVPGTAALNKGGIPDNELVSVSCSVGEPGECVVGGEYADSSGDIQAFVDSEVNETWQSAEEVPGTAALNKGGAAGVYSVSCAPGAGGNNCVVGGAYTDSSYRGQAFVDSEVNGAWQTAEQVPGFATLDTGDRGSAESVSCGTAGNCVVGGFYEDSSSNAQAFVDSEVNGAWQIAEEVPGTAALNRGGPGILYSVSCGSADNCSAVGDYGDQFGWVANYS